MVHNGQPDETRKEQINQASSRKEDPTGDTSGAEGDIPLLNRRSVLKITSTTAAAGIASAVNAVGTANAVGTTTAEREVSSGEEYETWTISGQEVYDLSDGEANVTFEDTDD